MRYRILALSVFALGCAEDYFPDAPDTPEVAHKKAVVNKQFGQMSPEEHKRFLGGITGAEKYFEIIAYQLAESLDNARVREVLYKEIPEWKDGETKLERIADDYPDVAAIISRGLKRRVENRKDKRELSESNELALSTITAVSDDEALRVIAGAMFDLEIVLVNPDGNPQGGQQAIPVHWIPINDDSPVLNGFGTDLKPATLPASGTLETLTVPYLQINFDENPKRETSSIRMETERGSFSFFVTSAHANYPDNHGRDCYHERLIQIAKEIEIFDDNEPGPNKPEIQIEVYYTRNPVRSRPRYNLEKVDDVDSTYTIYDYKRAHGTCGAKLDKIQVWEDDVLNDDSMACWTQLNFGVRRTQYLNKDASSCGDDARLVVAQKDRERGAPPRP